MGPRTLLPDSGEVLVDQLKVGGGERLIVVLRPAGQESRCPLCRSASLRIHSWYSRRLNDLPWEGIPVRIELRVRRFFCDNDACSQRIFTEQLPQTAPRYARRTGRLSMTLKQITWALGGSAGSRLAQQLGILTSGWTLLRHLRRTAAVDCARAPRVLGIDDWAWRKGRRYGTILCDLENGEVADLLPDRSAESTEQWLLAHPGAEIISRDRASLYAEAAAKAAPRAVQVADRWHLLHNMLDALIEALAPHHRLLTEVARAVAEKSQSATEAETEPLPAKPLSRHRRLIEQNRERRMERYQTVTALFKRGVSQREIARQYGLNRTTVRRFIRAQEFPERKARYYTSILDPHRNYLETRWREGCHNCAELWRELCSHGFEGRSTTVRDWISKHQGSRTCRNVQSQPAPSPPPRASPRHVAWLLLKQPDQSRLYVDELVQRSSQIAQCASLSREFFRMVREKDPAAWPAWQSATLASPLANFARHLQRDEHAFLAALQQPWSNGPVEGHVQRLKLIKRSMYGRAKFDLLRLRVLHTA
jgi:transposase